MMSAVYKILLVLWLLILPAYGGVAEDIAALQPGEWYEIQNSAFSESAAFISVDGNGSIFSYSGGVYDSSRRKLVVWGGGHADSKDNGIYAFNLNTFAWENIEPRSSDTHRTEAYGCTYDCSAGYLEDGKPIANHTYQMIAYNPTWDAMVSPIQGAVASTDTCYSNAEHFNFNSYDFDTNTWGSYDDLSAVISGGYYGTTLVDGQGNVWVFQTNSWPGHKVWQYKTSTNTWHQRHTDSGVYALESFGAIDPIRNIAVVMGGSYFTVWDLSDETAPVKHTTYTGNGAGIVDSVAAGLYWDNKAGVFVGWIGASGNTARVYTLDVDLVADTRIWTEVEPAATNTYIPSVRATTLGPYGRWAYDETVNVFVLATNYNQNVLIYKHTKNNEKAIVFGSGTRSINVGSGTKSVTW